MDMLAPARQTRTDRRWPLAMRSPPRREIPRSPSCRSDTRMRRPTLEEAALSRVAQANLGQQQTPNYTSALPHLVRWDRNAAHGPPARSRQGARWMIRRPRRQGARGLGLQCRLTKPCRCLSKTNGERERPPLSPRVCREKLNQVLARLTERNRPGVFLGGGGFHAGDFFEPCRLAPCRNLKNIARIARATEVALRARFDRDLGHVTRLER